MLILLPLNSLLMEQIADRGRRAKGKQSTSNLTSSTSAPPSNSNTSSDSPNQDGDPESASMPNFDPPNYQPQPQPQPQSQFQPQPQSQSQSTASTPNQTLDNSSALFNFDFDQSIFTDGNDLFGSLPWTNSDLDSLQQALEIDPVFFTTP